MIQREHLQSHPVESITADFQHSSEEGPLTEQQWNMTEHKTFSQTIRALARTCCPPGAVCEHETRRHLNINVAPHIFRQEDICMRSHIWPLVVSWFRLLFAISCFILEVFPLVSCLSSHFLSLFFDCDCLLCNLPFPVCLSLCDPPPISCSSYLLSVRYFIHFAFSV